MVVSHSDGNRAGLSPERMLELFTQHGRYEYDLDLDGTMSTIAADPLWEIEPIGMRIVNRDSVRTSYAYQFEYLVPRILGSAVRTVGYGDLCLLRESTYRLRMPDGSEGQGGNVIVIEFDEDGLITSERGYTTGAMTALVATCFPSSIWELPGVSRITDGDSAPTG